MKENIKTVLILLLGALAAWYAFRPGGEKAGAFGETAVVIAARFDLPQGTVIAEDMIETITIPRRYMQNGAYELRSMADIKVPIGLVAAVRIPKGDQITQNCLKEGMKLKAEMKALDKKAQSQERYVEGLKYFQNANYEKAREEWKAAVKLYPKNADAVAGLVRIKQITASNQ